MDNRIIGKRQVKCNSEVFLLSKAEKMVQVLTVYTNDNSEIGYEEIPYREKQEKPVRKTVLNGNKLNGDIVSHDRCVDPGKNCVFIVFFHTLELLFSLYSQSLVGKSSNVYNMVDNILIG